MRWGGKREDRKLTRVLRADDIDISSNSEKMPRIKGHSLGDGHRPGVYQVMGRAPGHLPVWARIRSIRRGRRSSLFQSWTSQRVPSSAPDLPEITDVVMGDDDDHDVTRLSLEPVANIPLDLPPERPIPREYQSWRENVDIPREADSQRSSRSDRQRTSSSSDETTDYSLPSELRHARNRERSLNSEVPGDDLLPNEPSLSTISQELRIDQVSQSGRAIVSGPDFLLSRHTEKAERRSTLLLYLYAILIGVGIGLAVGIPLRNNNTNASNGYIESNEQPHECNHSGNDTLMHNPFAQCDCDGSVTLWTDEMGIEYDSLRVTFMPSILPEFNEEKDSCDPTNTALWQLSSDVISGVNATDSRYMLNLLYGSWDGEGWRSKQNWLSPSIPECQWEGIGCNQQDLIRSISLQSNNLGGTIPTELALMTTLRIIQLGSNRLSGTLPTEIFTLRDLVELRLEINFLSGTIPSLFSLLPFLESLQLEFNFFSGTIPQQLGSMFVLKTLTLGDNGLTGEIPSSLSRLPRLETLTFNHNALTGTIPPELGRLGNLKLLSGGSNFFRGRLISEIGGMTSLQTLDLGSAGLAGEIPSEIGANTDLSILSLAFNNFVGTLPISLATNLTELSYGYFSGNGIEGTIPSEIGTLSELTVLELDGNFFGGTVPSEFGSLSLLAKLNLGELNLSGSVPREVCDLRQQSLEIFIAPCTETGVVANTFQCYVPECCTECVT